MQKKFIIPAMVVFGLVMGINLHDLVYGQGIAQLGTIADWAMVGVTAVTLYFLYQQFAEMRKASIQSEIQQFLQRAARLFVVACHSKQFYIKDKNNNSLNPVPTESSKQIAGCSDSLSLIREMRELMTDRLEVFCVDSSSNPIRKIQEITHICCHIQRLCKQLTHYDDVQDSLYDECNAFASEFLQKVEESKAKHKATVIASEARQSSAGSASSSNDEM